MPFIKLVDFFFSFFHNGESCEKELENAINLIHMMYK